MKTIIVINDDLAEAEYAVKMAVNIAQKVNANILLVNVCKSDIPARAETVSMKYGLVADSGIDPEQLFIEDLISPNKGSEYDFTPRISCMDASGFSIADLAQWIIKNNIWMMIKGTGETAASKNTGSSIDIQYILNRVACPLFLTPLNHQPIDFRHIAYIADLRYCHLPVVRYLAKLAKPYAANLQIAHIPSEGLPDMAEKYAISFFNEVIGSSVDYDQLLFHHIKEKNVRKVVDVMTSGMHTDLLVFINRQFHFEELIGRYITRVLPEDITVPILIFPC